MNQSATVQKIARQLTWMDVDENAVLKLIDLARMEDLEGWGLQAKSAQTGDVTSQAIQRGNNSACARLVAREPLVVCGLNIVQLVLRAYGTDTNFEAFAEDGEHCVKGECLGKVSGPAGTLLGAERIMLNFLQKLSGIASITRSYVDAMGKTHTRLLDTRKTTPGYRVLEKYAVACGGGFNHRIGLFDRVMLKDNHLAADKADHGGALEELVKNTRQRWPQLVIQLEVDRLEQIEPALKSGVDVFLLDNFSIDDLKSAIKLINGKAATEASGGITIESLPELAAIGLNFISTGATIHQSTWKDIGLDWE